ncbi:MAG: helicase-related protein [Fimbriimonadaceae bacterium]
MRRSSIVDNLDENTLSKAIQELLSEANSLSIASAFFSLDAFSIMGDGLASLEQVRLLFGDEASATHRSILLEAFRQRSETDLRCRRERNPFLANLRVVGQLIERGCLEARCYTKEKFHAKAYLIGRRTAPEKLGFLGSSNFTTQGLTQNVELNVDLSREQAFDLNDWYEARWQEAQRDVVTEEIRQEVNRHINLYEPYLIYAKALKIWGESIQGCATGTEDSVILPLLDAHQVEGFRRALRILELHHGVMVCDGVGLGKSFIALALMEALARGSSSGAKSPRHGLGGNLNRLDNILLISPKNIKDSTWDGYLRKYLRGYLAPFGTIHSMAMTELGFDPDADEPSHSSTGIQEKRELVRQLHERTNVVVVDESHNFRNPGANRYKNLLEIMKPFLGQRKKVILLTATPINTRYFDLAAQLALIAPDGGSLAGHRLDRIRRSALELDRSASDPEPEEGERSIAVQMGNLGVLDDVLESILIQRSRQTCKRLSAAAGKRLLFPIRRDPTCIEITLPSDPGGYADLIELADRKFRPGVDLLRRVQDELDKVRAAGMVEQFEQLPDVMAQLQTGAVGLKLSAFLTEQYRRPGSKGAPKTYATEVHLARLVFANALKQLESSPPAFQGIIQSLGSGLIGRLIRVFGEDARREAEEHFGWVQTPLSAQDLAATPKGEDQDAGETETTPTVGDEVDAWLEQVISTRGLDRKLRGFTDRDFDTAKWRNDIVQDLKHLKEIHTAILEARRHSDPKLERIAKLVDELTRAGRKVLVFTQSLRTAEYLEQELSKRLSGRNIARIDSRVATTRASILHAFCPKYNEAPDKWAESIPRRIDVLVSTDVLAEGVNLQEAEAIVNYDIHWNPVRLIQRIGRVDRRLDPAKSPEPHEFDIFNVLPPPEIDRIINLVGTVEGRTLAISRTVGLDMSFFKPTDPAGNLREFNSDKEKWDLLYEGDVTPFDAALEAYIRLTSGDDSGLLDRIARLPEGALSIWDGAPRDGVFACYIMEEKPGMAEEDRASFADVLGKPILAIAWEDGEVVLDAPRVLGVLSKTKPGELSGKPCSEDPIREGLKRIRKAIRGHYSHHGKQGLPRTIVPMLSCVMELRKRSTGDSSDG